MLLYSRAERGFTVLEAVIASFLLLTAIALTVLLVDSTLQSQANNERRLSAVREAENALEEIRAAAALDYKGLESRLNGGTWPSSDSSVSIKTFVSKSNIVVPSNLLESDYPVSANLPDVSKKILRNSVLKVEVEARFGEMLDDHISLIGYVPDSHFNDFNLRILPQDGVVATTDQVLNFRAVALDAQNQRIEDLILTWYVEPVTSFGTIFQVSRDGQDCVYKNSYEDYNSQFVSSPGYCRLVVRAVYKGREQTFAVIITNS